MNAQVQRRAQYEGKNLIFAFPIEIKTNFPVTLCHDFFSDFIEILDSDFTQNLESLRPSAKNTYIQSINEFNVNVFDSLEKGVNDLIAVFLSASQNIAPRSAEGIYVKKVRKVCTDSGPVRSYPSRPTRSGKVKGGLSRN